MAENDAMAVVSDMQKLPREGLQETSEDGGGMQNAIKVSSEADIALSCATDKLANLENLLVHVVGGETIARAIGLEDETISAELIEKCFTTDLLHSMLNFELRELDNLLGDVQDRIVDALQNISSYEQPTDLLNLVSKFQDSEELLKQLQERILEMKMELTKLQMTSFSFKQNEWKQDLVARVHELPLAGTEWKPQTQTHEQRRTLRMLEKSLARELELEKNLAELKQNEQDHKVKIRLVEQVSACMEEAAEVAWSRFLEVDNRAEVLMGISKELMGKLQIFQYHHSGSLTREEEIKSKLQICIAQLNEKETSVQRLESNISHLIADNAEVTSLREKVQMLDGKLSETESWLKEASASNETSQQKIKEMEVEMESLRENMYAAESRAGIAEEKVTHLTDSNVELTEELEFLKGSNDSNSKKVSLLEKQLRELDIQHQHARASTEASQEQQNMLYSAIWDMETLIDELKQKVATAESKTESMEERCILLSETNSELNKELSLERSRLKLMEQSLDQAAVEKRSSAKDISLKTGLIMDTVMQLALERERIQKQLISLTEENVFLRKKTNTEQRPASPTVVQESSTYHEQKVASSCLDSSADVERTETSVLETTETKSESPQVEELPKDATPDENEIESSSCSANDATSSVLELESDHLVVKAGKSRRTCTFTIFLVLLVSILIAHLFQFHREFLPFETFQSESL